MNRLPLILIFVLGTPLLMLASLRMTQDPQTRQLLASANHFSTPEGSIQGIRVFAALPDTSGSIDFDIQSADARPLILHQYLQEFNSPLVGYENEIITASDKYSLDFRLLTAIARQESGLCEFIPAQSYNCWGWGIHEQGTLAFDNYQQAIWTVAQGLRTDYLDKGLETPEAIMSRYTPRSNGSWAVAVNQFIQEME